MNIIIIFLVTMALGIVSVLVLKKVSEKTGFLVDVPAGDALKIHKKSIPLLGGTAMALAVAAGLWIFLPPYFYEKTAGFFAGLLVIFLLGFYDDLKWKHVSTIKPLIKFSFLIACTLLAGIFLYAAGLRFCFLPFAAAAIVCNFIYIFVVINAINYQDGMDGLAGGLAGISLLGFLFLSFAGLNYFSFLLSLIVFGAVVAFLLFNLPPAGIFMGDSGAYALGFILATLAISFSKPYNVASIIGPLLIIGLPIIDGVFTNLRRLAAGKSIFLGDRSHFYDRLLQKGFSTQKTLAICYSLQIILMLIGILIYR